MEETQRGKGIVIPGVAPTAAEWNVLRQNYFQLVLLATLLDQMSDKCITNTAHILRFAKVRLEILVALVTSSSDSSFKFGSF